ncbi:MAG TPA: non-canonical purine NTP pyrophosphatase [Candidatus Binataceae bacterium]|nr:non-canonical purine NTP pyrophosphatase [Candidatus Binataceae bacterium]
MAELLIATSNRAKLDEYRLLLDGCGLAAVSLRDVGITEEAPEDADSFVANARAKARFYFDRARLPTLADDGGLEVDALNGAPGVHSHRWLGVANPDDRALAEEVVRRMSGVPAPRRIARLRSVAVLLYQLGGALQEAIADAALEGVIADRCFPEIRPGFPYRSVLYLPAMGKYLAEVGEREAAQLSHRHALVEQLRPHLARLAGAGRPVKAAP